MALRSVLVVDDDREVAGSLADALAGDHWSCQIATTGDAAIEACRSRSFDVVLTDVSMPGMDGVELMSHLKRAHGELPVILITASGSIPAAVRALKGGAAHYLTKPCSSAELRRTVEDAAASRSAPRRGSSPQGLPSCTEELLGESALMRSLRARIELTSRARCPVLVIGETGTGKELVARAIHACSDRRSRPFVTVNASAIPTTLLESEMFGHVRGAFTGATQAHRGLFSEADGGTLFLDEIGDMPLELQSKLLRVLQAGELRAVGDSRVQRVDVRVVAATHRRLPELVREGRFREDLYYRLNVIALSVPPLRSRRADVPELAQRFLQRARERSPHSPVVAMSPEVVEVLCEGDWPGNVRELQSTIEALVVLGRVPHIEPSDLALVDAQHLVAPESISSVNRAGVTRAAELDDASCIDDVVRHHVENVLHSREGNKAQAAKILGIDLSTLYRWQQKWSSRAS